ncbi:HET-domain-containing protein [Parathielavia hyrcaniae]|uniref:HET-domain-containing protein n=1 Tax=Parathielavia hyrcaniae TaxID=113614 RepID=A0AAN6Q6J1_9PEZI|nr:HET-domain-containing protein [Parathielavia hyrcaniae]
MEDIDLPGHQYLVLSYVWGRSQLVKLETCNKDALSKPGTLAVEPLSQTFKDSILLTKSLGFRYLWIDKLCILQDDDEDKQIQIGSMNQIYSLACLTIVDASSSGVNGGLPGLRPGTRTVVQEEVVVIPPGGATRGTDRDPDPGLSLMTTLQRYAGRSRHFLDGTPWDSRGWTMQERVFSRRMLVFTPEQVYWACWGGTFCEESCFENQPFQLHRSYPHANERDLSLRLPFPYGLPPDIIQRSFWTLYDYLVFNYTNRNFTYAGDIFDGFSAVSRGFSALSGENFSWGLPRSHFEAGLVWDSMPQDSTLRRRNELSTLPMTSFLVNVSFPSWTWMGWIGRVVVSIAHKIFEYRLSREVFVFEHHHDPLRLEPVQRTTTASGSTVEPRALPSWNVSRDQPATLEDLDAEHQSLRLARLGKIPESLLLFFWASSAFFTLERPDGSFCQEILNSSGDWAVASLTGPHKNFCRGQRS